MATAYLGPEGTFTETAARLVTDDESLLACGDISAVLRQVEVGEAARGVVPIENTLEGSVRATVDALAFDTELLIEAELELPITLVLATEADTPLDAVVAVRSHPVALSSARYWLRDNLPDTELLPASSTARAAQVVAGHDDDGIRAQRSGPSAAIVNPLAAERYGLVVVAEDIADTASNTTRFVVVGPSVPAPTGWDKTSVVVFIDENRPGALLGLLEILAEREIDMTRLESRPTKAELGSYCFFLDFEGHLADERVGDALAAIKRTQRAVRLLGSYPRAGRRSGDEVERIARDDQRYREAADWVAGWRDQVADAT